MKKILLAFLLVSNLVAFSQENCLNFKNGDYLDLGSNLPQQLSGDSACTIEFWFKGTTLGTLNFSGNSFQVGGINPNLNFNMNTHSIFTLATPNIIADNNWHHVAYTFAKGKEYIVYIDGFAYYKRIPQNVSLPVFTTSTVALISNMIGTLDEFRVWDIAKTEADIKANMYCNVTGTQSNLLVNLKFNQGAPSGANNTVTIATDASGNNNNGTLFGFTLSGAGSNWIAENNNHANLGSLGIDPWVTTSLKIYRSKSANIFTSSAEFNNTNELFYAFKDDSSANKCSVVKKVGDSLEYVGLPGFSAGSVTDVVLKVDSNQNLVVLCQEASKLKCYKYIAGVWQSLGIVGATYNTNNSYKYYDLAIGSNDSVFVAYADSQFAYKVAVKKFDGTSWVNVGNNIISVEAARFIQLEMTSTKVPHLLFTDNITSGTFTIKSFSFINSIWTPFGNGTLATGSRFVFKINPITDKMQLAIQFNSTCAVYEYNTNFAIINSLALSNSISVIDFVHFGNNAQPALLTSFGDVYGKDGTTFSILGVSSPANSIINPTALLADKNGELFLQLHNINVNQTTLAPHYKGSMLLKYLPTADKPVVANATLCGIGNTKKIYTSAYSKNKNTQTVWYSSLCPLVLEGVGDTITISPTSNTKYYISTQGNTISGPYDTAFVKIDTIPNVIITTVKDTVCKNEVISMVVSGSNTYSWTPAVSGTNVLITATTTYTVIGTNSNGCTASATKLLVANPTPTVQANISDSAVCKGDTVTFFATGSPGPTYNWTSAASNSVVNNVPIAASWNGTNQYFYVTATDANGCTSVSNVILTQFPAYKIKLGADTILCKGDAIVYTVANQSSYLWYNGSTSTAHTVDTAGTYWLQTTNSNGCKTRDTVVVTLANKPNVVLSLSDSVFCRAKNNSLNTYTLTGGSPAGGFYTGSPVSGTILYTNAVPIGVYPITYNYTDANKCKGSATKNIRITWCLGVDEDNLPIKLFTAYPNPANETITIDATTKGKLQIINAMGQIVNKQTISKGVQTIYTQALPVGIYTFQFVGEASQGSTLVEIVH